MVSIATYLDYIIFDSSKITLALSSMSSVSYFSCSLARMTSSFLVLASSFILPPLPVTPAIQPGGLNKGVGRNKIICKTKFK